jgi:hypothetical protein
MLSGTQQKRTERIKGEKRVDSGISVIEMRETKRNEKNNA